MNTRKLGSILCAAVLLWASTAAADEALVAKPIPGSAHEVGSAMDDSFDEEAAPETKWSELLESSKLTLKLRNFYLNRGKPEAIDSYAWAQGGILAYSIGRVEGIFSLNAELMGSYPIYAPEEHDGTALLEEDQDSITIIGVANPRFTAYDQVLSLYRQRYNLPYVNEQDSRMLPNTFEGYTLAMPIGNNKSFQYVIGYIDQVKKRDSDEFVAMSDTVGGVSQLERGIFTGGLRFYPIPEWSFAGINHYLEDVLNIFYGETIYKTKITEDIESTFSAQYSAQSSTGDDLLRGESYSGEMWGAQGAFSYEGIVLKLAVNLNDDGALLRAPWGSYPGYNSSIVEDFNRAGEDSWQVGLSYDLSKAGVNGVSVAAAFIQGNSAIDETSKAGLPDKDETDLTIDYRPKEGLLADVWIRLRGAWIDEDDHGTTEDYRVIVNYDVPLIE